MLERFKHWNIGKIIYPELDCHMPHVWKIYRGGRMMVLLILVLEADIYSSSGDVSDCRLAVPFVPFAPEPSTAGRGKPSA